MSVQAPEAARVRLPQARGDVSEALLRLVAGQGATAADVVAAARAVAPGREAAQVLGDEDLQLALWLLYEAHYRGAGGLLDRWEWDLELLGARAVLEEHLEAALRELVQAPDVAPGDVAEALFELTAPDGKPGLAAFMARRATLDQWREWFVHRSVYQLNEADPHTWAIPRLSGAPKAALVEVQADEYGGGSPERMHSALFARSMRGVGLVDDYTEHLDSVPALSLAVVNTVTFFGLHRRLLGAVVGHLAGYEMTSSLPHRLYGNGLRRLGFDKDVTWFFDEHVEADAVHEQIVGRDLAAGLAAQEPWRTGDIMFGAAAGLAVADLAGAHFLSCWEAGRSSLRAPLTALLDTAQGAADGGAQHTAQGAEEGTALAG
ncbi:iron-containing redox enzyme family protein [Quadrisphaera sp. DSM 44207]|uniref:iron-containing redox enzyme family protein n=1 Tax=Quadrisphaera sp. DSM 44207 TaxID=1881057 RepID=UPI00087E17CB|nr:iron-containing redox enzyme family protein [Quadrisphaera sp. DSM 44207]SDQ39432.1 Iron-containing redox enzyme [Quadrisphaera sp. DSM 44207]